MISVRKWVGFVMALAFAAFALPSSAAGPVKIFGLVMSPSTPTTTTVDFFAKFSNATPNGNSVINTVILTPPAGLTNIVASFPNGGNKVACPATTVNSAGQTVAVPPGSICVANIPSVMKAGCSPVACSWQMKVTATLPNSCSVNTWAGQAFAGNSFNGDVFAFQSGISSVMTTVNYGCTYNITATANPTTGGTVSCSPNPVTHNGTSTCTATPNTDYTLTSFSGDCSGSTCVLSNVTSTKNVTANFTHNPIAVVTSVTGSGTVNCAPNPVPYGGGTTCTASAGAGYGFVNFTGDCSGTSCTLSNVTSTKNVTANFAQNAITATASPAAGGSVICTPNPVPYGGNSSCIATANALYTFTGFSGDCSGMSCTFSNVTANKTVTAIFVSNTLAITSSPSSAAVGKSFDVVIGSTPTGANVSFAAGCDASSSKSTLVDGSTKFTITINTLPAPPSTCTMTFTAPNYNPIPLNNLQVYNGVLDCFDYDSINGPGDPTYDPDAPSTISGLGSAYVGYPGWGLRRGPNKDGAACKKVNYTCDMTADATTNIVTCTWDKNVVPAQQATFKYLFLWAPRAPQANGWTDYRPQVSWNIASPSASPTLPDWVPLLSCLSDTFPALPTLPTTILPVIPSVAPFTDSANLPGNGGHAWYQPGQTALVCGGQQGWTAVGGPGNPLLQIWNIIIDEADLKVSGP